MLGPRLWFEFAVACRGLAGGWIQAVPAFRPRIDARTVIVGLLPSKASRLRRNVRWDVDPLVVSTADTPAPST